MTIEALDIAGAWVITPEVQEWAAGLFYEPYRAPEFADAIGHELSLGHVNVAVARAGSLRGIHYGDVPPGQAKYVTCVAGAIWDVVVDLRVGSPSFGQWCAVHLDDRDRRAVYLGEGLGHGYLSLEDHSVLMYICSQPYIEGREHRVNSLDPDLAISWPDTGRNGASLSYVIGRNDRSAPSVHEAMRRGTLPTQRDVDSWLASLAG